MNKLELFLENIIDEAVMEVSEKRLAFQSKELYFLFQRNMDSTSVWLDCSWIEENGKRNGTSYLRFDFPVRTIQNFLMKHTNSTLENRHSIIHKKSVPNNKDSVILPVYEAFVKAINENQYPIYKNSILKNKIERSLPEKDSVPNRKIKI
jgi:hypothetical protein